MKMRLKLPQQAPPIRRDPSNTQEYARKGGVEAAQTPCDNLTGMARQLCYSSQYGVDT